MAAQKLVVNLYEVDKGDIPLVGGKGANLGEMVKAGFPVPPGFAVTVWAYDLFLSENGIVEKIDNILSGLNPESSEELENASRSIQKLINSSKVPQSVADEVIKSYKKLSPGLFRKARVAVRSSATAEDLPGASFAGQQASFLNVIGDANLLTALRSCWASLFTPRAIFYRIEQKIAHKKVKISVIIQKMVQSETSGVMFSIDPVTNNKERIVIESVWGLGEMIVQGSVVPDKYTVQKGTFEILFKTISDQDKALVRKGTGNIEVTLNSKKIGAQKITDEEIIKLAKISDQLQRHYYFPQDTEWAKENGKLYIVQTRPITTLNSQSKTQDLKKSKVEGDVKTPILTGAAASPGFGTGPVKILKDAKEIGKVKLGDVLVAPMTSPDFVPAMKKAKAIVTDQGGQTSHAAIVSRELGIPCVVGTKVATKVLEEGSVVTVDGKRGTVYTGDYISTEKETKLKPMKGKTATKVYVNLGEPEMAEKVSKLNVDGVGLLRAEFMIANIGIHPSEAIQRRKQRDFIDKLKHGLTHFCKSFYPRPVVYRATDFKTNEYRSLPGGKAWEPEEPNPMLGFRGAVRYISNPEVFNLELQAIKDVRKKYNNLWMMIPFVRSPQELSAVRKIVEVEGLFEEASFKFWMMVELPINVILLDDFIDVGIDGVSIGSNDLTMLIEGTDRDNSEVSASFNEMSPAVLWAIKKVIKTCQERGISSSICGQAPSTYDELLENLVKWGATSVSINPDSVDRVRRVILDMERKEFG